MKSPLAQKLVLVDTSAWIQALRPGGPERARREVARLVAEDRAAVAGIILLELLSGVKTAKEYRRLKEDLEALVQLAITEHTWQDASRLAFDLRRKGITVPATDVLVMTVSMANACALIHADQHFDLMAQRGVGLPPDDVLSLL